MIENEHLFSSKFQPSQGHRVPTIFHHYGRIHIHTDNSIVVSSIVYEMSHEPDKIKTEKQ